MRCSRDWCLYVIFFFSSRRRHTRCSRDWGSDVCSSDLSKDKESFGKGRIEGVFAPETAAHASGTSALLPMLALGIPGSGTAAILLGGLMVWGLKDRKSVV